MFTAAGRERMADPGAVGLRIMNITHGSQTAKALGQGFFLVSSSGHCHTSLNLGRRVAVNSPQAKTRRQSTPKKGSECVQQPQQSTPPHYTYHIKEGISGFLVSSSRSLH